MSTVQEIIEDALRKANIVDPDDTIQANTLTKGLRVFGTMVEAFSIDEFLIYFHDEVNKTLTAGDGDLTIGTGGDFDTARPIKITNAWIPNVGQLDPIGKNRYARIPNKTAPGTPSMFWYNPEFPLGLLYLYPVQTSALSLYLNVVVPLTAYTTLGTTVAFPPGYNKMIIYNLAVELGLEWGRELTPEVSAIAGATKRAIQTLNAAQQVEAIRPEVLN